MVAAEDLGAEAEAADCDKAEVGGDTPAATSSASKRCRTSPSNSFNGSNAFSFDDEGGIVCCRRCVYECACACVCVVYRRTSELRGRIHDGDDRDLGSATKEAGSDTSAERRDRKQSAQ